MAKRKGGLVREFFNTLLGEPTPTEQEGYISQGSNLAQWGGEYDETPLSGTKVLTGGGQTIHCNTVGEYKAACEKLGFDLPD